ncbi:membrane protein [Acinetobacter phage vB_AbaM_Konradin]|uniref:Uncharacterized protein n=1 Tax=Acinetobacter phage vB_AbaM_Konradin TaxID=2666257 RepID=A0A650EV72_9CAUD|nr:membrane protein [Acinetobacter phage vB_AbaM_Konradin]QGT53893.1 hypothetical protein Konradin_130 [Acinetobacter phage vB_AbaM_Konradin]
MEINKSSWHYRFLRWTSSTGRVPDNLCGYVRTLLIKLSLFSIVSLFIVAVCGMVGLSVFILSEPLTHLAVIAGPEWYTNNIWVNIVAIPLGAMTIAGIFAIALGGVFGVAEGASYINNMLRKRSSDEYKSSSLIFNYLKAKHSKICQKLDFKD